MLRREIQSIDIYDRKTLQMLPYLNGFIHETLRLYPPVPSGGYRQSPPEGMTIAGRYIPENTTIVAPRYTLEKRMCQPSLARVEKILWPRSLVENCFEQADKFIPERWYDKPEMMKNRRVFAPFAQDMLAPKFSLHRLSARLEWNFDRASSFLNLGRYNCVGKGLALVELRFVTVLLVLKYEISFATGEDGSRVLEELRNQFTAAPGKLRLRFAKRKSI